MIKHYLVSYRLKVSYTLKVPLGSNSRGIVVVVAVWVVGLSVVKVVGVKVGLVAIVGSSDSRSSSKSSNVSLARRVVSFFANLQNAF